MNTKNCVVIFCDDFRINDNPALYNACQNYDNIIPLYVYEDNYLGRNLGSASKVFLYRVLESFNALLKKEYGINLIIRSGNTVDILNDIINKINIDAIYFNRSYTQKQISNENLLKATFNKLDVKSFKAKLLFDPTEIQNSQKSYFKVFTSFSNECLKNKNLITDEISRPNNIKSEHHLVSLGLEDLNLLPKNQNDWHKKILKNWSFEYDIIKDNFMDFVNEKLTDYPNNRNIPSLNGNSNISPYLRFGMLSPKFCFNIISFAETNSRQFTLELLWREFAYHVMFYNQDIANKELKKDYESFKWDNSLDFLSKWQQGQTGFDIVDSGMKELWQTGVMHNRVRMIAASFLIKDLLIDWKFGENWFWNTLVDADPAINPFSWQWVFGSGFDSAPYFRIFNPELQADRFDPNRIYCKKWLQNRSTLDKIIDHDIQRKFALQRYKTVTSTL